MRKELSIIILDKKEENTHFPKQHIGQNEKQYKYMIIMGIRCQESPHPVKLGASSMKCDSPDEVGS